MIHEYYKAADRIREMIDSCEDRDGITLLKECYTKIFQLAENHNSIIKTASIRESDNETEEK